MTLSVPNDLQYALLEFIAHINVEDFESLPKDFVNLGFSPSDKLEQLENSGITEGLSFALRQLNKGKSLNLKIFILLSFILIPLLIHL